MYRHDFLRHMPEYMLRDQNELSEDDLIAVIFSLFSFLSNGNDMNRLKGMWWEKN